jgi:dimethylhistidine N-methyltransferase
MTTLEPHTTSDDLIATLKGLHATPRTWPTWLLYDARGSQLFEDITRLDDYYPTRTEMGILDAHAAEMARAIGSNVEPVESGAGSSDKVDRLLATGAVTRYIPVDVSPWALEQSIERVTTRFPNIESIALEANYVERVELPNSDGATRVAFFPGSTIGNFHPSEACAFLRRIATAIGPGQELLIGTDMRKDPAILTAAYNDQLGITAAFNMNLLVRANREWGTDFDLDKWKHLAHFNPLKSRIEMHLFSLAEQTVHVGGEAFAFEFGESIWTESSYKFTPKSILQMAKDSGFVVERHWSDPMDWFRVTLMRVRA